MHLTRTERLTLAVAAVGTVIAGILAALDANAVIRFVADGITLAALAAAVGDAVDHVGERLNPGATGVLQSALGNLPELFVSLFALRQGLVPLVKAALVGSILANQLLVLGAAFLVGGLRHGTQRFESEPPRMMATLMLVAVAALAVPTLAERLHTPAASHEEALAIACSVMLLLIFAVSVPYSIRAGVPVSRPNPLVHEGTGWSMRFSVTMLAATSVAAALVSDWFVNALTPAMGSLHISQAFTGLVVVAIAGNAVENVVGVQLAARNQSDTAVSVVLNSPLQIAIALIPLLVLLSFALDVAHLTLVLPPLLLAALTIGTVVTTVVVYDGESIWLEGLALIGLYAILAAPFWWG